MLATFKKGYPRLTNHLVLGFITLLGCIVAVMMAAPGQSVLEMLSIGTGYIGLILIAATLLIGPLNMLKVRKNPVNLNFRRDTGIWAGITSLAHVALAFALELNWGGTLLGFFLNKDSSIKLNLFGISNFIGLVAALVIIFLLVLSNNYFLKMLKGKRWKAMQRFNYLLFGVAFLHTFTQQVNNLRGFLLIGAVLGGTLLVLAGQMIGFTIYRQRAGLRKASEPTVRPVPLASRNAAPVNPYLTSPNRFPASPAVSQASPDYSDRQMAAAFGVTAFLAVIVGLLGFNLVNNQANASNNTAPAFNNGNEPANAVARNSNNSSSSNSSSNSGAASGSTSNPFNGTNPGTRARNRATIKQPSSGSSSPIHTGGS